MSFIKKLFYAGLDNSKLDHRVISHQWENVTDVWNNTDNRFNAIGIERIFKLILILTQFITPGLYIRALFGAKGKLSKHIGVELHVIFKLISAFLILKYQLFSVIFWGYHVFLFWVWWMIFETVFYTANLVFCNDVFASPHSYKRNIILIFVDYIQLTFDYASIYLYYSVLKTTIDGCDVIITRSLDAAYFSFISSLTIGYGDIVPANDLGKKLVIGHIMIFLVFGVLFINFYTSRIEENKKDRI